jgi:AcrR family transcriptional regulator
MPTPPRVQPPKQPRSRKTLERIVAAGLAILEEDGPDAVTVQAVVRRSRTSVGSFYARFKGKVDLLAYLAESVRESAIAEWRASVAAPTGSGGRLPEAVVSVIDHLIEVRDRWDAGVRAAAGLPDHGSDHDAFCASVVDELASRLLAHRSEMTHDRPEVGVRVGLRAAMGVIDHEDLAPDDLRRECIALLMAYLGAGPAKGEREGVEFFDVWS